MEKKKIFFVIFLAVFLTVLIGEAIIRLTDISGVDKNTHYTIDPLIGYGDIPYEILYYRNDKGDVVRRRFNSFGYLDVEHKKEKNKGTYRIGFFGDSYVEARQVGLEDAFFRIIEKRLKDYNVECLAFGRESGGTLVAYLNNIRWSSYFDLDSIVYVFCENDPGDNLKIIKEKTAPHFPFAVLTPDGYRIDYSNRDRFIASSKTLGYKAKRYLSNHLLLARLLKDRIGLLKNYGAKFKNTREERMMATRSKDASGIPDQNDLPSTWPDSLREYVEQLAAAIISKWKAETEADLKNFAILYIPRQGEMEKETDLQDSWKSWLESFCRKEKIAFIDPAQDLIKSQRSGREVFYDHLTIYGHSSLAVTFVKWVKENLPKNRWVK